MVCLSCCSHIRQMGTFAKDIQEDAVADDIHWLPLAEAPKSQNKQSMATFSPCWHASRKSHFIHRAPMLGACGVRTTIQSPALLRTGGGEEIPSWMGIQHLSQTLRFWRGSWLHEACGQAAKRWIPVWSEQPKTANKAPAKKHREKLWRHNSMHSQGFCSMLYFKPWWPRLRQQQTQKCLTLTRAFLPCCDLRMTEASHGPFSDWLPSRTLPYRPTDIDMCNKFSQNILWLLYEFK